MAMPKCLGQLPPMAQVALSTVRMTVPGELWDGMVPDMDAIYETAASGDFDGALDRAGDLCERLGLPREQLRAMVARFLCPTPPS